MFLSFWFLDFISNEHFFHFISVVHFLWCRLCSDLIISRNCTTLSSLFQIFPSPAIFFYFFFKLTCLIAFNNTILWLPWPFRYSNYICPSLSTSTSLLTSYIPGIILSLLQIPPWTHLPPLSFSHSLGNFPVLVEPSTWKTNHLTENNVIF